MFRLVKRAFDLISSIVFFTVISPLFLTLMLLVRIKIGQPVFFKQERTGRAKKMFYIHKFRSMTEEKDSQGKYLPDEVRITKFGNWLRKTSLDELPELLCIIKGEMSVIGPRPLPTVYDEYYTEYENKRFKVRGGLIPPEVLYDNVCPTWSEQLKYEAYYADNLSLKQDMKILLAVFKGLLSRARNNYGVYNRLGLDEERKKLNDCVNSST